MRGLGWWPSFFLYVTALLVALPLAITAFVRVLTGGAFFVVLVLAGGTLIRALLAGGAVATFLAVERLRVWTTTTESSD